MDYSKSRLRSREGETLSLNGKKKPRHVKRNYQQKCLSSHLKETPKQYIEVSYRIFNSALFREILDLIFAVCMIRHNWSDAILFSCKTMINMRPITARIR